MNTINHKLSSFPPQALLGDILKLTQSAAVACASSIGAGGATTSDSLATDAMRKTFQTLPIKGTVVIGEGERDKAPMLYIGEKVGRWHKDDPAWDIAVDPLEGTNLCATARGGALSVLALAPKGGLCQAPDVYMQKIACGPRAKGVVNLKKSAVENVRSVANILGKKVKDTVVSILNRPRHKQLIQSIYDLGAKVYLIEDGDLSAAIQTCLPNSGVDLVMGSGGSPEGVLSAAALKCLGGEFQGQFIFSHSDQKKRAYSMGIKDPDRIYSIQELVPLSVVFCATGVTNGRLLKGVHFDHQLVETHTLYMDSDTKTHLTVKKRTPIM